MSNIFKLYQQTLNRRPFLVQAVQTGVLMGAGDIISQTLVEKKTLDLKRTFQFSSVGFFVAGPVLRGWYGVLTKYIGSSGKTVTIKKVLVDQALFAPCFLGLILGTVGAAQGKDLDTIKKDVEAHYFDILKANYFVWPWVQLFNFYYIPLQHQVLLVQAVALFWNTYFAWKINQNIERGTKEINTP